MSLDYAAVGFQPAKITTKQIKNFFTVMYSKQRYFNKISGVADDDPKAIRISRSFVETLRDLDWADPGKILEFIAGEHFTGVGVEKQNGKVTFVITYCRKPDDVVQHAAYMTFLRCLLTYCAKPRLLQLTDDTLPENQKYFMRRWLLTLGMSGFQNKMARAALLKGLDGCSAFKDPKQLKEHNLKHKRSDRDDRI